MGEYAGDRDEEDADNLPVPNDRVRRLKDTLEELEGGGVSEMMTPLKAFDVGDVDERPNPRASDIGYVEGGDCAVARNLGGEHVLYDEENGNAYVRADDDAFIGDVSECN